MRRFHWKIIMMLGILSSSAVIVANASYGLDTGVVQSEPGNPDGNLLVNPSFEDQFSSYIPTGGHPDCPTGICQTVQIASDWTPWWVSHDDDDPDWIIRNPEYKPAAPWENRIYSGSNAQQYFTFHSTHRAGIYQRVSAQPGRQYRFTIWGHSWASTNDNPYTSDVPLTQKIGIDPTGGTDWKSSNIVWSPPHQQHNKFGLFTVCAVARSNHVTVFAFSEPEWPGKHNDVYWDEAQLTRYDGQCQLAMEVHGADGAALLTELDNPRKRDFPVSFIMPDHAGIGWEAEIRAGGTLTPTLKATSGSAGENLVVTIDSHGYALGRYETAISVNSVPSVPGSPMIIPVALTVTEEILNFYFPVIAQN